LHVELLLCANDTVILSEIALGHANCIEAKIFENYLEINIK